MTKYFYRKRERIKQRQKDKRLRNEVNHNHVSTTSVNYQQAHYVVLLQQTNRFFIKIFANKNCYTIYKRTHQNIKPIRVKKAYTPGKLQKRHTYLIKLSQRLKQKRRL